MVCDEVKGLGREQLPVIVHTEYSLDGQGNDPRMGGSFRPEIGRSRHASVPERKRLHKPYLVALPSLRLRVRLSAEQAVTRSR